MTVSDFPSKNMINILCSCDFAPGCLIGCGGDNTHPHSPYPRILASPCQLVQHVAFQCLVEHWTNDYCDFNVMSLVTGWRWIWYRCNVMSPVTGFWLWCSVTSLVMGWRWFWLRCNVMSPVTGFWLWCSVMSLVTGWLWIWSCFNVMSPVTGYS